MDAKIIHSSWNFRLTILVIGLLSGAMLAGGCSVKGQLFVPEHRDPVTGEVQIPKEAEYVAGGRGELSWKIPHDGRVYVRDSTAETVDCARIGCCGGTGGASKSTGA